LIDKLDSGNCGTGSSDLNAPDWGQIEANVKVCALIHEFNYQLEERIICSLKLKLG
jgi:hypothetical protein